MSMSYSCSKSATSRISCLAECDFALPALIAYTTPVLSVATLSNLPLHFAPWHRTACTSGSSSLATMSSL